MSVSLTLLRVLLMLSVRTLSGITAVLVVRAILAVGLFVQVIHTYMHRQTNRQTDLHTYIHVMCYYTADIDECLEANGGCINANCDNSAGTFACVCEMGFVQANQANPQSPCSKHYS